MRAKRPVIAVASVCMMHAYARSADAQPAPPAPAHDPAAAEAAFAEARALMRQGKLAEACPKLEASFTLDPALGTLLNLGDCFEKTGRTASAWVRYREAAAMAVQQNQREREAIARARVSALEPRLCRLEIRAQNRPELEVQRDGVPLAHAAIGLPVPVDPGTHVIEAKAPGATPFSTRVEVRAPAGDTPCPLTTVDIPALDGERPSSTPPPPLRPVDLTPEPGPPPPAPSSESPWRTQHTLSVVAAAGGLVAIGVGSIFALSAASTKSDADAKCTAAGCTAEGKSLLADAGQKADVATVTFVVGAALVATGAVLWLTSPSLRASATARELSRGVVRF